MICLWKVQFVDYLVASLVFRSTIISTQFKLNASVDNGTELEVEAIVQVRGVQAEYKSERWERL